MAIRFSLLGPVRVTVDGAALAGIAPRHRAVLAYLLLNAGRVISMEKLIDAVWGIDQPETARSQVHAAITALRRALRTAGVEGVVETRSGGYVAVRGPGRLDVQEFTDLVTAGRFRDALARWQGDALADVHAHYAPAARALLEDRRLAAVERLMLILDVASAMLDEMPVGAVTLNELSRRVGLAKPNVLRYFESREPVLLELLDRLLLEWLTDLADELAADIDESLPMDRRAAAVAETLSRSLAHRVVMCDLFGAQGGVLEHNVSVEVVARYKRASLNRLTTMTGLLQKYLPELGENATLFSLQTMVMAGALSAYGTPPPSLRAAYEAEPELARFHMELKDSLRLALNATLLDVLPRH